MRVDLQPLGDPHDSIEDATHVAADPETACPFGDGWLADQRTPVLRVTPRIVEETTNLIRNPLHPATATLAALLTRPFTFHPRLFSR